MPRRIVARTALRDLAFDIQKQLDSDTDPKRICDISIRRLNQLKNVGFNYFTDWSRASDGKKVRKVVKEEKEDSFEKWRREEFGE